MIANQKKDRYNPGPINIQYILFIYIYIPAASNVVPFGARPKKDGFDRKKLARPKKVVRPTFFGH